MDVDQVAAWLRKKINRLLIDTSLGTTKCDADIDWGSNNEEIVDDKDNDRGGIDKKIKINWSTDLIDMRMLSYNHLVHIWKKLS